ncbi:MAG: hypothetical protein LBO82_02045 [Synergistaceae bacterium]|jgi:ABC-type transporter Mla subunit MlaD|nr:hypothetical protein [Synergistaceae bacterium]
MNFEAIGELLGTVLVAFSRCWQFTLVGVCLIVYFIWKIWRLIRSCGRLLKDTQDSESLPDKPKATCISELWDDYLAAFHYNYRGELKTDCDAEDFIGFSAVLSRNMSRRLWDLLPATFVGLGILGTFVGLASGIGSFDTDTANAIQSSIKQLLSGMNTAFDTSIVGMSLSITIGFVERFGYRILKETTTKLINILNVRYCLSQQQIQTYQIENLLQPILERHTKQLNELFFRNDEQNSLVPIDLFFRLLQESEKQSRSLSSLTETIGNAFDTKLTSLQHVLTRSTERINELFFRDDGQNKPIDLFINLLHESEKQSKSLSNFSTDLAEAIGNTLDTKLTSVFVDLQKSLQKSIDTLRSNNQENAQNLVSDVVGNLQDAIVSLPGTLTNVLQEQVQQIGKTVEAAAGVLEAVPEKFEDASSKLLETISKVPTSVGEGFTEHSQNIGRLFSDGTEKISTSMQAMIQSVDAALSNLLKTLTQLPSFIGGEFTQQTQNISRAFSEGAERFDSSTRGMIENLEGTAQRQKAMSDTLGLLLRQFEGAIENSRGFQADLIENMEKIKAFIAQSSPVFSKIEGSLNAITESEQGMLGVLAAVKKENATLSEQRVHLNETTQRNIADMSNAITDLRKLHEEYAQKFPAIRDGLGGVFKELSSGLTAFQGAVHEKMNDSIAEFSRNFSEAASNLASAVENLGEFLEDLEPKVKANIAKTNSIAPSVRTPSRGK